MGGRTPAPSRYLYSGTHGSAGTQWPPPVSAHRNRPPWSMVQNLEGLGFTVVPFGQGFKDMSPPTKRLMELVLEKNIAHGGHPVLRWMMDNIFVRTDPAGNIKPDKPWSAWQSSHSRSFRWCFSQRKRNKPGRRNCPLAATRMRTRISRNTAGCALSRSSGGIPICWYFRPSSKTATFPAFLEPP